jgi:hypothetical protein
MPLFLFLASARRPPLDPSQCRPLCSATTAIHGDKAGACQWRVVAHTREGRAAAPRPSPPAAAQRRQTAAHGRPVHGVSGEHGGARRAAGDVVRAAPELHWFYRKIPKGSSIVRSKGVLREERE